MLMFIGSMFLFFVLVFLLYLTHLSQKSFKYWKSRNVYTLEPTILFGNAKDSILQKKLFGFDVVELYDQLKKESKRFGGYYMFMKPVFVPTDLDLIKKILISDFNNFTDRVSHVDDKNDPLSANVLFLKGDRWKQIRQVLRQSFSSKTVNEGMPKLTECTYNLLELIERTVKEEYCLDIKKVLDKYNLDVIGLVLINVNCNTLLNDKTELEQNIEAVMETSVVRTLVRLLVLIPQVKNFLKTPVFSQNVTKFFINFVNYYRTVHKGLINSLTTNLSFSKDYEIAANVAMAFLAGYDTTSNTSSFCLYELALNLSLQEAVRQEIYSVLKKHNGTLTYEALGDLELLEKCLRETLRKYPVSTLISRVCSKPYAVPDSDIILEKNSHVYIPIRAIHLDSEYYPNPELFDPERFSEGALKNRHSCAWIPFSVGSRHCIGYKLAKTSMKMSIAHIVKNYRFSLHPDTKYPLEYDPHAYILQAKDPIKLCIVKITNYV